MADGSVTDDTRLRATPPTVTELADRGAIVLLLAHFGRPQGQQGPDMSLSLVTRAYGGVLGRTVRFGEARDRKSVVWGKRGSGRVVLGGCRSIHKKPRTR